MKIYYFSGTGNSLAVARGIAERTGGRLVSIPSEMDRASVRTDADAIGLVFPVHHKSIPLIIKRFVGRMGGLEGRYVFAVCTYGDSPGLAIRDLGRVVESRGGRLAAGYGLHMPYSYLTPSPVLRGFFRSFSLREVPIEKQEALFAAAQDKVGAIAAFVNAGESGQLETTSDVLTRLADRLNLPETLAKGVWLKVAGVAERPDLPFLESRQLMDRAFYADGTCNGCGICAGICPVSNIELVDDRPVWQQHCEQCFACLQWCPQEAIQFGAKTAGASRYHHPDVTLADMLRSSPKG